MTEPHTIRNLLQGTDFSPDALELITVGASSEAWKITVRGEPFALRVFSPGRGHSPTYEFEYGLRSRLRESTALVPEPIATHRDFPSKTSESGRDWIIDRFVEGTFLKRGEPLPDKAIAALSEVLKVLHAQLSNGHGAFENTRNGCFGTSGSYTEGLCQRFPDLWPFRGSELSQHPVSELAPHLTGRLDKIAEKVLELPEPNRRGVTHFDLHNEQLILAGDELGAVIDFGASIASAPAWDFASFLYFHSLDRSKALVEQYAGDRQEREELDATSWLFAILIGVHHVRRSFQINRPARREFALKRIASLLDQGHPV